MPAKSVRSGITDVRPGDRPEAPGCGLCVTLLGGFQVAIDGRIVDDRAWQRRKSASLVKLLALSPRHRMHREEILEHLWPEQDPGSSAANLRVVLHAARQALLPAGQQGHSFLQAVNDEIVLQVDGQPWIDVEEFEREAARAERTRSLADYQRALDLYQGELLPSDRYEDWVAARRERLHDAHLALLVRFAEALSLAGDESRSIEMLERALAGDPTHEQAAARLMDAYARSGQRPRALRLFRQLRDALAHELDAAPDVDVRRLYGEILAIRGSQAELTVDVTPVAGGQRSNLPVPLTRLIGRENQIASTAEALAMSRLVTLTGAGGSGKTRLAIAVAESAVHTFPDGVWWVDLSPLAAGDAIPHAIASALSLRLDPALDGADAVVDGLAGKRLLLVLDNCEHLIESCAQFAGQLLRACRDLRILATSREPLHIEGETILRVPVLPLPHDTTDGEIADSDAVQLFCDRARYVQPDFELTPANAATLAGICRRLDGLPLAIELAAARVSLLSLEQLAGRLSDPLQVLAGGRRTDEPRQQTLRATLDWSFDLLDSAERLLLTRLSVFAGSWGLDAAEAICFGDGVERRDVLSLLAQLVDKSLVEVRPDGDEARYRLLETVRQYAAEKREAFDPNGTLERRHADYFLDLAETADPGLLGGEQEYWLERLELELDNLRAALHWLERAGDAERQLRIASSLVRMWWIRGYVNEGRRWLEGGLALAEGTAELSDSVKAKALQAAGNLARMQGDPDRALELLEACLAIRRIEGEPSELAHALNYLSALLGVRGDLDRGLELATESRELFKHIDDPRGSSLALGTLGELSFAAGEPLAASEYLEEALGLVRAIGDTHSLAITLNNLGEALRALEHYDQATARFEESLAIFRELEATHGVAYLLANLGDIARTQARPGPALDRYVEALELFQQLGYREGLLSVVGALAALDACYGNPERAVELFAAEDSLREAAGFVLVPNVRGDYDRAQGAARQRLSEQAFEAAWQRGQRMTLATAVTLAGSVELAVCASSGSSSLSPREMDVARLVARDMTNQQIAEVLGLSVRTAETHVRNILRKLGLSSRREIVDWIER